VWIFWNHLWVLLKSPIGIKVQILKVSENSIFVKEEVELLCSSIEYDLLYFWSMMNQLYNMNYYIKWTWTKHWTRGKWDIPRSSSHMMFFHANITQVFNGIKYVWDHFLDFENFKHFTVMGHHMKNIISFHNYIPNSYCQTLWPCSFFIDGKL